LNGQTLEKWDGKPWRRSRYKGRLILQTPVDLWLFTELIERVNPSVIVEVGMLEGGFHDWLYDLTNTGLLAEAAVILGIDIDPPVWTSRIGRRWIRKGDSLEATKKKFGLRSIVRRERERLDNRPVIFILDDDHTPTHVFEELDAYSALCKPGDWIVVCDTVPVPGLAWTVDNWLGTDLGSGFMAVPLDRFGLSNHRGGWLRKVE
jgi:cephalosporin hydroxylase